jgi:predicted nucleic acid-binding protein
VGARSFLDTNVLLYTDDRDAGVKQLRAVDLVEEHLAGSTGAVSTQVLQEYFASVTRKLEVDPVDARRKVELFARLGVVTIDVDDVLGAIDLHRLHRFSFWDALIVRAAKKAGCSILLTEDLQHGRTIDGLRIVNPFR